MTVVSVSVLSGNSCFLFGYKYHCFYDFTLSGSIPACAFLHFVYRVLFCELVCKNAWCALIPMCLEFFLIFLEVVKNTILNSHCYRYQSGLIGAYWYRKKPDVSFCHILDFSRNDEFYCQLTALQMSFWVDWYQWNRWCFIINLLMTVLWYCLEVLQLLNSNYLRMAATGLHEA